MNATLRLTSALKIPGRNEKLPEFSIYSGEILGIQWADLLAIGEITAKLISKDQRLTVTGNWISILQPTSAGSYLDITDNLSAINWLAAITNNTIEESKSLLESQVHDFPLTFQNLALLSFLEFAVKSRFNLIITTDAGGGAFAAMLQQKFIMKHRDKCAWLTSGAPRSSHIRFNKIIEPLQC